MRALLDNREKTKQHGIKRDFAFGLATKSLRTRAAAGSWQPHGDFRSNSEEMHAGFVLDWIGANQSNPQLIEKDIRFQRVVFVL